MTKTDMMTGMGIMSVCKWNIFQEECLDRDVQDDYAS